MALYPDYTRAIIILSPTPRESHLISVEWTPRSVLKENPQAILTVQPRLRATHVVIRKRRATSGEYGSNEGDREKPEEYRPRKPSKIGYGKVLVIGDQLPCHLSYLSRS